MSLTQTTMEWLEHSSVSSPAWDRAPQGPWALLIPESYPSHLQAVFLDFMSWVFPWPDLKSTERGHQDAKLHGAGGLCRLCFFISAPHASLTSLTKPKEHFP